MHGAGKTVMQQVVSSSAQISEFAYLSLHHHHHHFKPQKHQQRHSQDAASVSRQHNDCWLDSQV